MFNNRGFNAAFVLSLAWHLLCMGAVNIVILPGNYQARDMTSVSFLGPILEKTALEIILANKPVAVTTSYRRGLRYNHALSEKATLPMGNKREMPISTDADNIDRALNRLPRKDKEIPNFAKKTVATSGYSGGLGEISGNISDRELIYRPEKPELPAWVSGDLSFSMELEFIVSAQGEVEEVIPVAASGSPEVDLLGIRYLKSWRFAPLAKGAEGQRRNRIKFIFGKEQ